jgi:putative Holliday junction resolvase
VLSIPETHSKARRVLALDVGSRRIGLAVSDALGITAQGLDTLNRTNKRADLRLLGAIIRDYAIAEIVVGNPLRMSGDASSQSDKVAAFADDLRKHFRLPVFLWDERLTSVAANRILDEAGMSREQRKGVVDRMAAVLILQAFLEARSIQPQL